MKSLWTGSIGFGLVNIPVKLYSAVQNSDLDLDMLDKKDHSNIRFKRVNAETGKEVLWENIVKGYKINDRYVVLDEKDFEAANAKKTKVIEIMDFVQEEEIDSTYYEVPYYLEPDKSGARAYALFRAALEKSKKVGVANFVLRSKEHLAILRVSGDVIILNKIRFYQEIRETSELKLPAKSEVKPKELQMALSLIDQLTSKFDISKYKDTYADDLMKVIKAKAKGARIAPPKLKVSHKAGDLMAQLKDSLANKKKKKAS
jgi:DNA end-binding protein Ku